MGLSFSVPHDQPLPPSLRNICRTEIQQDLGQPFDLHQASVISPIGHNKAYCWQRGAQLDTRKPLSIRQGWEQFTDALVQPFEPPRRPDFLLWGSYAQKKAAHVAADRHHLLKAPHPSPLSAHRGFFGSKHFSTANTLLQQQPIQWLPQQR